MIKIRAWDDREKEYIKDVLIGSDGQIYFDDGVATQDDLYISVEQLTGLKDVNGKDIYEGDIIEFFGANKKIKVKNEFGVIVYQADRYGAGFNSIIQNKEHGYGGINIAQDIVIGNVHENPELLEE